jgi:hypothetical protein
MSATNRLQLASLTERRYCFLSSQDDYFLAQEVRNLNSLRAVETNLSEIERAKSLREAGVKSDVSKMACRVGELSSHSDVVQPQYLFDLGLVGVFLYQCLKMRLCSWQGAVPHYEVPYYKESDPASSSATRGARATICNFTGRCSTVGWIFAYSGS